MNELIKITDNNGKKAVSARELHLFLESKKQFADWIKHRISKYELIEGTDYQSFSPVSENGRPSIEYALTLDAAKELSMVEGNAKGKQARKYFIACEKQLKEEVKTLTSAEILLEMAQQNVNIERKQKEQDLAISHIDRKLNGILELQASSEASLMTTTLSNEEVPEVKMRDKVRMLVNKRANALCIPQQKVWDDLYYDLYYRYGISIRAYSKEKNKSWLDVAERIGCIDKLYALISEKVRVNHPVKV